MSFGHIGHVAVMRTVHQGRPGGARSTFLFVVIMDTVMFVKHEMIKCSQTL